MTNFVYHKKTYPLSGFCHNDLVAVKTGEFRPPRKGEFYLSGAIVEAWRAPNNLPTSYEIAMIVSKGELKNQRQIDLQKVLDYAKASQDAEIRQAAIRLEKAKV